MSTMAEPQGAGAAEMAFDLTQIVNVASVPQRSPFRYPGGKTWLVPHIRQWLRRCDPHVSEFIEPFAGGAIVGLTVAFERLADSVMLIEKDEDVAAVWMTILNVRNGRWLADRIAEFEFTEEHVRAALETPRWKLSFRERAFKTILRNRVQRGGILAPGAGVMKIGENGRGLASRWYPETLRRRILAITELRHRITFEQGDGIDAIRKNALRRDVAFFIDPPYTIAGRRLYTYSDIDHEELFRIAGRVSGDFLMTYDNTDEIRRLAERFGFETRLIAMKNTHNTKMTELLIGRHLDWLQQLGRDDPQASLEFELQTLPG
jgi:DNA adenine methylase